MWTDHRRPANATKGKQIVHSWKKRFSGRYQTAGRRSKEAFAGSFPMNGDAHEQNGDNRCTPKEHHDPKAEHSPYSACASNQKNRSACRCIQVIHVGAFNTTRSTWQAEDSAVDRNKEATRQPFMCDCSAAYSVRSRYAISARRSQTPINVRRVMHRRTMPVNDLPRQKTERPEQMPRSTSISRFFGVGIQSPSVNTAAQTTETAYEATLPVCFRLVMVVKEFPAMS